MKNTKEFTRGYVTGIIDAFETTIAVIEEVRRSPETAGEGCEPMIKQLRYLQVEWGKLEDV